MDLDVIVEIDPRARHSANSQSSAGKAMRASRSIFSNSSRRLRPRLRMGRSFMRCMTSAIASLHSASEKKVSPAAAPECRSGETDAGVDFRLVPRLSRPRRQDADRVMRRHGPVGPVDLGIVEGGLVDPALQIVGNQQLRRAAEKAEHAHVGAGPVLGSLRPRRLGIGEI